MSVPQCFLCFLAAFNIITTSLYADEISLQRLMMLHDLMPEQVLQMDGELHGDDVKKAVKEVVQAAITFDTSSSPVRVLIDVRSNHSDGAHNFDMLINMAKQRFIDTLVFTEHDRFSIRFGIDPVPDIFGYSKEHPSLYTTGLDAFFDDLSLAQQQYPDIELSAGTESIAGYYWQGIPFKNLSLHNPERHFIALGVKDASQIQGLSSYDLRHGYGNKELSLAFWFVFVFVLMMILLRKRKRLVAMLLVGSFIAFMSSWLLKPKVDADVDFINTAHEQGLFVAWTHPGTLSGVRPGPMGVQLNTPPYSKRVFEAPTADAFTAVYGDTDQNTMAGGMWDNFMMDYMKGYRPQPIWAISAGDYHEEGQSGEYLGNFPMDVWAKSAHEDDVLAALKQGKMVSWGMNKLQHLAVKALYLEAVDPSSGEAVHLLPGGEAVVGGNVALVAALRDLATESEPVQINAQWIVDGHIAAEVMLSSDEDIPVFAHQLHLSEGVHVIRLKIPSQQSIRMEANPFMVQVRK
ncbi:MAG: hypothetical protein R8M45_06665 [Ghiorsea sp.]